MLSDLFHFAFYVLFDLLFSAARLSFQAGREAHCRLGTRLTWARQSAMGRIWGEVGDRSLLHRVLLED